MGWASKYIEKLKAGETVSFRPHGNSMKGKVESGQLCTVAPITTDVKTGDIVLCKVGGSQYLHLVKGVQGDRVLIGNNKGYTNGWTSIHCVYGKLIKVED